MPGEREARGGDNSSTPLQGANDDDPLLEALFLDCAVDVEDRTWPGMNKQGGIAKVKAINKAERSVDVQFVLDKRKEQGISIDYVVRAPECDPGASKQQKPVLRDRSGQLGRCTRCRALRKDCGFCDWKDNQLTLLAANKNPSDELNRQSSDASSRNRQASRSAEYVDAFRFDGSASEEELEEWMRQEERKLQQLKREQRRLYKEDQENLKQLQLEAKRATGETNKAQSTSKEDDTKRSPHTPEEGTNPRESSSDEDDDEDDPWESSSDEDDLPLTALGAKYLKSSQGDGRPGKKKPYTCRIKPKTLGNKRRKGENEHGGGPSKSVLESLEASPPPKRNMRLSIGEDLTAPSSGDEEASKRSSTDNQGSDTSARRPDVNENNASIVGTSSEDDNMSSFLTMDIGHDDPMDDQGQAGMDSPSATAESQANCAVTRAQDYDDDFEEIGSNVDYDHMSAFPGDLGLKEFIQPEGEEVAENLPEDIKDRAADVTYTELPIFLDTEAARLEMELLPDAKLKVAELERRINHWRSQGAVATGAKELLQSCESIREELHVNLIRDGIDQCNSAMRRLLKKAKNQKLSWEEKPKRRLQEFKLDCLQLLVEEVMKKLRNAQNTVADNNDDEASSDQDLSGSISEHSCIDNENSGVESDNNMVDEGSRARGNTGHLRREQLSPWDRHKHAKRVRQPLSEAQETRPSLKRCNRGSTATISGKKRSSCKHSSRTEKANRYSRGETRRRHFVMTDRRHDASGERTAPQTHKRKRKHKHATYDAANNDTPEQGQVHQNQRRDSRRGRTRLASTHELGGESRIKPTQSFSEGEEEVPPLEELLGLNISNRQNSRELAPPYNHENERRANSHVTRSMTDRMQAFLDSNADSQANYVHEDDEVTIHRWHQRKEISRRERQGLHRHDREARRPLRRSNSYLTIADPGNRGNGRESLQRNTTPGLSDTFRDQNVPSSEVTAQHEMPHSSIDARQLIRRLTRKDKKSVGWSPATRHDNTAVPSSVQDLAAMCEAMERLCPMRNQTEFIQNLKTMTLAFGQRHSEDNATNHTAAVLGFRTMLTILQSHYLATTLQEILTRSGNLHVAYVTVISATLSLIEKRYSSLLKPDDGLVFKVFSPFSDHPNGFVAAVTLQLVDSLYAVFHPKAWACPSGSDTRVVKLNALTPLRDALAAVVDLPADICRCITTRLDSQKWRLANIQEKHAFISSVDPDAWRKMLQSGESIEQPKGILSREPTSYQTFIRLTCFDIQILASRFSRRIDYHGVKSRRSGKFLLLRPTQSHAQLQPESILTRRSVWCRHCYFVVPSAQRGRMEATTIRFSRARLSWIGANLRSSFYLLCFILVLL
jgi:hypothetical protein